MSSEPSGNGLDVTLREFVSGQKIFNRYRLVKTLGRGGMGIVWLARDEELERDVALKFLPDLIIHDRAVLGDLKRETRRSLELTHKNIVRIYDFVHDEVSGCISMEYVDGDTLSNLRADKPTKVFETHELTDWISQLCDALDYAHNHARIVHRDLKPANLMVNQRSDLKVADFGIARSLSDSVSKLTMQQGKSGTLVYMSPQQLEGERGTPLDDVYSVGASVYELLTSKPPFYSGNIDRQIREKMPPPMMQRRGELEVAGEPIDPTWEEVIRACLAKDPTRRPQSVSEIASRLEVPSPKTRRAAQAGKPSNKRIGLLIGVSIIAAATFGGWYFWIHRPTQNRQSPLSSAIAPPPAQTEASISLKPPAQPQVPEPATSATISMATAFAGSTPAPQIALAEPKVVQNALYEGTIRVKNDNSTNVPLAIAFESDRKFGTMTQSGRRGDVVVKFTGVWDGSTLHAVTDQVVSMPTGVHWEPESFTLYFADDGKSATYECIADGKTYVAQLSAQATPVVKVAPVYKGMIGKKDDTNISTSVPLTINFGADRKSGTMTQSSKSGDTIVRFNGVWDGTTLRAVTDAVVSKPKNVQWEPESFTLRFAEDGRSGSYECNANGQLYTAQLSAP